MADDEKTLHIRLSYDGADQKPPADSPSSPPPPSGPPSPNAPPSPQAPAAPHGPGSPPPGWTNTSPGGTAPPTAPAPQPTVGIPNAPPTITPGGGGRVPIAPPTGPTPGAGAATAAGAGAIGAAGTALVVVGAAVAALGALATATQVVVAGMSSLADKLGELNPGIATANAVSNQRKLAGDIQQGQQLSGEMQGFIGQRTTMDLTLQRIETSLVKDFSPGIEKLLSLSEGVLEWIEIAAKAVGGLYRIMVNFEKSIGLDRLGEIIWSPVTAVKEKLESWLGIQIKNELNADATQFQQELLNALDPRRPDILKHIHDHDVNADDQEVGRRFGQ